MRPVLLVAALLAPALAGCLVDPSIEAARLQLPGLDELIVPEGAIAETIPGGLRLAWADVELPFRGEFSVPEGAAMVRLTATAGDADVVSAVMRHAESNRRRCQTPSVVAWNEPLRTTSSCIGLTAIDPPGATWAALVTGSNGAAGPLPGDAAPLATAALVHVDFLAPTLEGPAAALDLAQLSMPTFELLDTETVKVESHDGILLHVEVTRPDTDASVPAVIVSTPYNTPTRLAGARPSDDLILDWGKRGYAIVVADVRGFGESGGCVEVWGKNEQLDQVRLVEWVAEQAWSDGNVGFYGQSYVGTTPVEAAVNAPEALKAIVAVAPVTNAYDDWHFGGVGNGEDMLSPVAYMQTGAGAVVEPSDPLTTALNHANGVCDPGMLARANDPRAIYDAFYVERNFSARAADVTAAVLYTQGFEDSNVKSAMITHWFNALNVPKLGLFGHWVHQHPPRADQEVLFLAWMDQYVKGKPMGFDAVAPVSVITNAGTHRAGTSWPPLDAVDSRQYFDFANAALVDAPADGGDNLELDQFGIGRAMGKDRIVVARTLDAPLHLAGAPRVEVDAHADHGENGYVAAYLYDGDRLVTFGMFNLAHRFGHDQYQSLAPLEFIRFDVPLLPTEHVFAAGSEMRLELRGAATTDWALIRPGQPTKLAVHGGEPGTVLVLPTVPAESAAPLPAILDWRAPV